jgi:hypothetical protein
MYRPFGYLGGKHVILNLIQDPHSYIEISQVVAVVGG